MKTLASRFLSFEETLGAGLVKFAYFVLLGVLLILTVIGMIGGIVMMFTTGFWAGLGVFLITPVRFLIALILLRVATEVVLAILSIDDHLTDGARTDGALPRLGGGSGGTVTDRGGPAPFTQTEATSASSATPAAKSVSTTAASSSSSSAAKPTAKKTTKKAAKKTTKKSAATKASGRSGSAAATSSASVKETAEAAKAATRPSGGAASGAKDDASPDSPKTD